MSSNDEPQKGATPVGNDDKAPTAIEYDAPAANLVEALARAQAAFPSIAKTKEGVVRGKNKQGADYSYTYAYADLADVLSAARPVLAREGIALLQRLTTDDAGKVRLVTELRRGDEVLDSELELGKSTADPQQFGGALTYLRRYSASTMLGIAPEEDLDAQHVQPTNTAAAPAAAELPAWALPVSADNMNVLKRRLVTLLGVDEAKLALETIRGSLDTVPALVNMTAGLLLEAILKSNPDELVGRLADEQARRIDAARKAEAAAAAESQAAERAEAETAQDAAEAPDVAPTDVIVESDPPAAETAERLATDAPGTVSPPDLTGDTVVVAMKKLRDAGCICKEPLAEDAQSPDNDKIDTACPLIGHGIAF